MKRSSFATPNRTRTIAATFAGALACALVSFPGAASAGIFGTSPVKISVGTGHNAQNGESDQPSVSGDGDRAKYVAFASTSSNLVGKDRNGKVDVFVWKRPAGAMSNSPGQGSTRMVSRTRSGAAANGASSHPSVDGSMHSPARCVAFQSTATNLARHDALPDSDIYVRLLRKGRTVLASPGVAQDATNPSISGDCKRVLFEARGKVWSARIANPHPRAVGAGSSPRFARDGRSFAYVRQSGELTVVLGKRRIAIGKGGSPRVSDFNRGAVGVTFERDGNIYVASVRGRHVSTKLAVVSAELGCSSYSTARAGIIIWSRDTTVYYQNRRSGNSDDIAQMRTELGEVDCSSKGNVVAFASRRTFGALATDPKYAPGVWVKWMKGRSAPGS
jgi:hypothetical protein